MNDKESSPTEQLPNVNINYRIGFSPTRQVLLAPSTKHREVLGESEGGGDGNGTRSERGCAQSLGLKKVKHTLTLFFRAGLAKVYPTLT